MAKLGINTLDTRPDIRKKLIFVCLKISPVADIWSTLITLYLSSINIDGDRYLYGFVCSKIFFCSVLFFSLFFKWNKSIYIVFLNGGVFSSYFINDYLSQERRLCGIFNSVFLFELFYLSGILVRLSQLMKKDKVDLRSPLEKRVESESIRELKSIYRTQMEQKKKIKTLEMENEKKTQTMKETKDLVKLKSRMLKEKRKENVSLRRHIVELRRVTDTVSDLQMQD